MKIMHVAGSPRQNGNSMTMAKRFLIHAEEKESNISTYFLNQMNYRGCQSCYKCKTTAEKCVLEDDLTEVLDRLVETDLLLISTPVYFGDVSGQLKCFIDRLFSFAKPDYSTNPNPTRLPKGKTLVLIQTQQANENLHKDVYEKYFGYFQLSGFETTRVIRGSGIREPENVINLSDIMKDVDRVAAETV